MKISIITSIYNQLENLKLILRALEEQSFKDFEFIIVEDDDNPETGEYIESVRANFSYPITHIPTPRTFFKRNLIFNKGLRASKGEYIVFLDGDCYPHRKWLAAYAKYLTPTTVCLGRRYNLNEKNTAKMRKGKLSFLQILLTGYRMENAIYFPYKMSKKHSNRPIAGCNWGVSKQALIELNGLDEDYQGWGHDDKDIDWRLRETRKYKFLSLKNQAIVYHLYHIENSNEEKKKEALDFFNKKVSIGDIVCRNGLEKL